MVLEVRISNGPHWLKPRHWQGCATSAGSRGESVSLPFQLLESTCILWITASSYLQSLQPGIFKSLSCSDSHDPLFCLWRLFWFYWAHLGNPGKPPHFKILNQISSVLSAVWSNRFTGPTDYGVGVFGGHESAYRTERARFGEEDTAVNIKFRLTFQEVWIRSEEGKIGQKRARG